MICDSDFALDVTAIWQAEKACRDLIRAEKLWPAFHGLKTLEEAAQKLPDARTRRMAWKAVESIRAMAIDAHGVLRHKQVG